MSLQKNMSKIIIFLFFYPNSLALEAHSYLQEFKSLLSKTKEEIMEKIETEAKIVGDGIEKILKENETLNKPNSSIYHFTPEQQSFLKELLENYRKKVWKEIKILSQHYVVEEFKPCYKKSNDLAFDFFQDNQYILPETFMFFSKRFCLTNKKGKKTGQEVVIFFSKLDLLPFDFFICTRESPGKSWMEFMELDSYDTYPINEYIYPTLNQLPTEVINKDDFIIRLTKLNEKLKSLKQYQLRPDLDLIFKANPPD